MYTYIYIHTHIDTHICMYICTHMHTHTHWIGGREREQGDQQAASTANLRTRILDYRGFELEHNLNWKGWNSQANRTFPGSFESTNLGRDNLSRETGRMSCLQGVRGHPCCTLIAAISSGSNTLQREGGYC